MTALFDNPAQMEPLLIDSSRPVYPELVGLVSELSVASARLDAALPASSAQALAELVSGMNCYYSNLIEGHRTLPAEIEEALFDIKDHPEHKDLHSLAKAHIAADRWARSASISEVGVQKFLLEVHQRFSELLPRDMLKLQDETYMEPGRFREREVQVGRHVAPKASLLDQFLDRYAKTYGTSLLRSKKGGIGQLDGILAALVGHHRLAWIHPFLDGNGRVARITLDAMLRECGINGTSLWSISRGFAKTADEYKARLAEADMPRMGDLDGRGNLSEAKLAEFCRYAIRIAIDQASFMASMFSFEHFRGRAEGYFHRVRFDLKPESLYLFMHAFAMGDFERMEAGRITGMPERSARDVLASLLNEGLLQSDHPRGKVRVGFPMHALGSLLPNLYPAGDLDLSPEFMQRRARAIRANIRALRLRKKSQPEKPG